MKNAECKMKNGGASGRAMARGGSPLTAPLRAARAFDNALAFVLEAKRMRDQERVIIVASNEPDERLLLLAARLHAVASNVACVAQAKEEGEIEMSTTLLRVSLGDLAAYSLIWLTTGRRNYVRGCAAIQAARERQKELIALGKFKWSCDSTPVAPADKFAVLFEECGEVAKAIHETNHGSLAASNITTALTQVAAVCVAWLESFEVGRGTPCAALEGGPR